MSAKFHFSADVDCTNNPHLVSGTLCQKAYANAIASTSITSGTLRQRLKPN
ncbi:hypothetical protein [Chamaesiphon sp.]|uniref:hypothetical protein n=1 Tax=Chamaesiphon sp. TaxID=2814140 RepID=UPI00359373BA